MTDPQCTETPRAPTIELRLGDYRTALADVARVDAVITDPPYSERTHKGQQTGLRDAEYQSSGKALAITGLGYSRWGPDDVACFFNWAKRADGWICAFTSHDLVATYELSARAIGRYVFAPISCVQPGRSVRLAGDGPANWADHMVVCRPSAAPYSKWGSLPGAYVEARGVAAGIVAGAKPLDLMRAIIRDYSRPGDLICDPCAGGATTLIAAHMEGRSAIGAELDPKTYDLAKRRIDAYLARGTLFTPRTTPTQETLIK